MSGYAYDLVGIGEQSGGAGGNGGGNRSGPSSGTETLAAVVMRMEDLVSSLYVIIENKIKKKLSLYFRGRDLFLYLKHIYNQVNKLIDRGETPL